MALTPSAWPSVFATGARAFVLEVRGVDEHARAGQPWIAAHLAREIETIERRQHQIADHEVGAHEAREHEAFAAIGGFDDFEASGDEQLDQRCAGRGVGIDDEDSRDAGCTSPGSLEPPHRSNRLPSPKLHPAPPLG